jgi:hypothetical protein
MRRWTLSHGRCSCATEAQSECYLCSSLSSFRFQLNLVQRLIFPREEQWRLGCSASDTSEEGKFAVVITKSMDETGDRYTPRGS